MIRLLKSSSPIVYVLLFIIAFITRLPILIFSRSSLTYSHEKIILSLPTVREISGFLNNHVLLYLFSSISIVIIGIGVQYFLNQHKVIEKSGNLFAWFIIVVSSVHFDLMIPSPPFIAFTLLTICICLLYQTYFELKNLSRIFNIGIVVAIASIFYFPFLLFIVTLFIGLFLIKPFKLNELIIYWVGILIPLYLLFTFLLVTNTLIPWLEINQFGLLGYKSWDIPALQRLSINHFGIFIAFIIMLYGFLIVQNISFKSLVHFRKFHALCIVILVSGILSLLLTDRMEVSHFSLMIIPAAFYIMFACKESKNMWFAESIHLVLLIAILISNIFLI